MCRRLGRSRGEILWMGARMMMWWPVGEATINSSGGPDTIIFGATTSSKGMGHSQAIRAADYGGPIFSVWPTPRAMMNWMAVRATICCWGIVVTTCCSAAREPTNSLAIKCRGIPAPPSHSRKPMGAQTSSTGARGTTCSKATAAMTSSGVGPAMTNYMAMTVSPERSRRVMTG